MLVGVMGESWGVTGLSEGMGWMRWLAWWVHGSDWYIRIYIFHSLLPNLPV